MAVKIRVKKRDVEEIWVWMIRSGNRPAAIARMLGVGRGLVTCTIHGRKNNRRVLRYMLEAGCPPEILDLPEDLSGGAVGDGASGGRDVSLEDEWKI